MKEKTFTFILLTANTTDEGPRFFGYIKEDYLFYDFTVYADFYQQLVHECDGDEMEADEKAITYAMHTKGYNGKINLQLGRD